MTSKSDELSLGESASPEKHGKVSYGMSSDLMVDGGCGRRLDKHSLVRLPPTQKSTEYNNNIGVYDNQK